MPYSFFGIGTEFIGKRDFSSDGSFVTTEFRIALLPLYPIRSVRVIEGKSSTEYHLLSSSRHTDYLVLSQGRVNVRQAAYVYGYVALHVSYLIALVSVGPRLLLERYSIVNPKWMLQFAMFLLPLIIPFTMRLLAKRRAMG